MGFLAQALIALFGSLIGWFAKVLSKKLLILTALTVLIGTLLVTLHAALSAALETASVSTPPIIAKGLALLPSNVPTVLSIIITAEIALWVFKLSRRLAEYRLSA